MQKMDNLSARKEFEDFILTNDHPCLMAQAVIKQQHYILSKYGDLGSTENVGAILTDIDQYIKNYNFSENEFYTFIAVFNGNRGFTELEFEKKLWIQLQLLHNEDRAKWDQSVEADPKSTNFSYSLRGKAFYIVGLHPNSSRKSRQAPQPTLIFNLHHQFEKLRQLGVYEQTRDKIRERDYELQDNINPMLADFGQGLEAPQYSGRKVGASWKCPFHSKPSTKTNKI